MRGRAAPPHPRIHRVPPPRGVKVLFQDKTMFYLESYTVLCISKKKRVRGFHQVSKRDKTFETKRPQAEWFYCFRAFGNLMKPEARVFEMTSRKKQCKIMQCCIFPIFL